MTVSIHSKSVNLNYNTNSKNLKIYLNNNFFKYNCKPFELIFYGNFKIIIKKIEKNN